VRLSQRTMPTVAVLLALGACSEPSKPLDSATSTATPVSFDGTYLGTIRVTSNSLKGAHRNWCETPLALSLSIQHNAFSYVLAHPNLPRDDPTYSPTLEIAVALDGSFKGAPRNGGPQMVGQITGSHMEGEINGLGCGYAFTAERS
jgi:hypothetical protein